MTENTPINEQTARDMVAVNNTRNVDKIVEQYSDDATFQVPGLDTPLQGSVAIRAFLKGNFTAFPDWTLNAKKVMVSGREFMSLNTIQGTHTGPLVEVTGKTIPPTNKKFHQELLTHVVYNEKGKVQSLHAYGNPAELYAQLGLSK